MLHRVLKQHYEKKKALAQKVKSTHKNAVSAKAEAVTLAAVAAGLLSLVCVDFDIAYAWRVCRLR